METKTVSDDDIIVTSDDILELFDDIRAQIETGIDKGWLAQRNMMYIKDIREMYVSEARFKSAGDGIDTIIHYVQQGESEAPKEGDTRKLMSDLGILQSKLHKKSTYYSN